MTDHWDFFPCTMGENQAFIFTDVGIGDQLSERFSENLVRAHLDYKAPADNGLPTEQEYESAKAIEDEPAEYVEGRGDAYVGRVTVAGKRLFFLYANDGDGYEERIAEIGDAHGYDLACATGEDPGHSEYWKFLWPTDADCELLLDVPLESLRGKPTVAVSGRTRSDPVIDLLFSATIRALGPLSEGVLINIGGGPVIDDWQTWSCAGHGGSSGAADQGRP